MRRGSPRVQKPSHLVSPKRREKGIGELAHAGGAGGIGNGCVLHRVKIFRGFGVAAQLRVEIAEQQIEYRVLRVARDERLGVRKRLLVFLVVGAQTSRENESDINGQERS